MRLSEFEYALPADRIALHPAPERDRSRLLVLDRAHARITHHRFGEIGRFLRPGDCLVLNETRVRRARLRARRRSGGRVEILVVRPLDRPGEWEALARAGRPLAAGDRLALDPPGAGEARIESRAARGRVCIVLSDPEGAPLDPETIGEPPIPPYIRREAEPDDDERYQTVYAREVGAVAAPTAGLHFTRELLSDIEASGVALARIVLHVGPGTFRSVVEEDPSRHEMDPERFRVPELAARTIAATRSAGGRVVSVGTTSARVLETLGRDPRASEGETSLFIHPPYRFRAVDALITNFHLPRSTLLMLVSAFAGRDVILHAYAEAIGAGYRFYSYGDAMLIQ